jgi:general secretion pathway protein G
MVVIVVIAILAAIGIPTMGYVNRKGAESRAQAEVAALSAAIDSFKLDFGSYPASTNLFRELTGQGTVNTNKIYIEPSKSMFTNNQFVDPWGSPYNYLTGDEATVNIGFFDLWSTAGNAAATNAPNWIRN